MTDHANELRRYARKIAHPAGDVPSVMLAAAEEIERLAARLEATEEDRARFLVEMGRLCAQCDALRLRIKAAEKERDALRAALRHEADCVEAAKAEIEALRAKIEATEQQEPARLVTATAYRWRYRGAIKWQYGELTEETARLAKEHNHEVQALGILPGAKGE